MKTFPILLLFFICSLNMYSLNWTRTFGGNGAEGGACVIEDSEGYYVVCGWTNSFGYGGSDVYVLKVDSMGDTVWTRTYGGAGDDSGKEIFQTSDGGYIIAGNSNSFSPGGLNEIYVLRLESNGDSVWTKTYGDTVNIYMTASEKLSDGGLLLSGRITEPGNEYKNPYLLRIDSIGSLSSKIILDTLQFLWQVNDIDLSLDGNYLLACDSNIYMKINDLGNVLWINVIDDPFGCFWWVTCIQETDDRNFIVINHWDEIYMGTHFVISKLDSLGNTMWTTFSNLENPYISEKYNMLDENYYMVDLKKIGSNKYILCGYYDTYGNQDALLYCFIDLMTSIQVVFAYHNHFYSTGWNTFRSVNLLTTGGFVISGRIKEPDQLFLVKTDSMEVFVDEEPVPQPPSVNSINVSSTSRGSIFTINLNENTDLKLSIYDVMGRLVSVPFDGRLSMGIHEIPFSTDIPGMYFFRLESERFSETGKFTVLR